MKKAAIVMPGDFYNKNRLFDLDDKVSNRDNCLYPFTLLKNKLFEIGYMLATSDIHLPSDSDLVIYNEMPVNLPEKSEIQKSYLILFESELIRPDNWDTNKHQFFEKIFTWHDDFVNYDKYIKINFPNNIELFEQKHLHKKICTLIAGNKKSNHPLELYSKRVEAIRWFEKNHPEDFDFYGVGWDVYQFNGPRYIRVLNRIKPLTKLLSPSFPSYKGKVQSKKEVLEKYKFAICFENARDIPGYITEKIFDCFFAGCVPIYCGPNNIKDHIAAECFIDFREFADFNALYSFINEMPDDTYQVYLDSINKFLKSDASVSFSSEYFADTIVNTLLKEIDVEA